MKICTRCKQEKPLEDFYAKPAGKQGRASHCKVCHRALVKKSQPQAYWTDPEVVKRQRATRYGLTVAELDALFAAHPVCAICGVDGRLVVDHDHITGKVRGMLCSGCNLRLGWVEQVGLEAVTKYLG